MVIPLVLLAGAMLGAGLWLLLFSLLPARPSLAASLARLRGDGAAVAGADWPSQATRPWQRQLGRAVEQAGHALGLEFGGLRKDLAITGQPLDAHLATKILFALAGGLGGLVLTGLLAAAGVQIPVVLPVWLALGLASSGSYSPTADSAPPPAPAGPASATPSGPCSTWSRSTWPVAPRSSRPCTTRSGSATAGRSRCCATPSAEPS